MRSVAIHDENAVETGALGIGYVEPGGAEHDACAIRRPVRIEVHAALAARDLLPNAASSIDQPEMAISGAKGDLSGES